METLLNNRQSSTSPSSGSSESSAPTSKRSRVVVSQSKGGCVTCKTRRVKCDEQRPLCGRCVRAGRLCGGYNHESKPSSALQPALKTVVTADGHTERLSHLAALVLSLDNNGRPLHEDGVWGCFFLQRSNQVECVKAATAAFGAAYESLLNNNNNNDNNAIVQSPYSAWRYYGSALAKLRSDFDNEAAGPESLALASMILACVEILSQHEDNAFAHFLGAVQILAKTYHGRQGAPPADILSIVKDELVKFDVSISSYTMSRTPAFTYLDSQGAAAEDDVFREPELAVNAAMLCLHRVYSFIDSAAHLRYRYPSWKDRDPIMCKGQSDAVTHCQLLLEGLAALAERLQAQYSPATSTLRDSETLGEIYAIRAQLTATLIFILCIHSPFETAYDEHGDRFRSIVSDAAAAARLRRRSKPSAFKRFSLRPGIVSPLFIVSMKCRDGSLRALVTTMLHEQEREGPTDGQVMAAIGARMAALEACASAPSFPGTPPAACNVLEGQRIHGYWVSSPIRYNGEGRRVVDVEFSRPNPPLMQGWGHVDYSNRDNWTFWSEIVEI